MGSPWPAGHRPGRRDTHRIGRSTKPSIAGVVKEPNTSDFVDHPHELVLIVLKHDARPVWFYFGNDIPSRVELASRFATTLVD